MITLNVIQLHFFFLLEILKLVVLQMLLLGNRHSVLRFIYAFLMNSQCEDFDTRVHIVQVRLCVREQIWCTTSWGFLASACIFPTSWWLMEKPCFCLVSLSCKNEIKNMSFAQREIQHLKITSLCSPLSLSLSELYLLLIISTVLLQNRFPGPVPQRYFGHQLQGPWY